MYICMQIWAYLKNFVQHIGYVVLSFQKFWFNFHRIVNYYILRYRKYCEYIYLFLFYWNLSHSIFNLPFETQNNVLCSVVIRIYSFYCTLLSLDPLWLSLYHPISRFALTDSINLLLALDQMLSPVASFQNCDHVWWSSEHIGAACTSPVTWKCLSQYLWSDLSGFIQIKIDICLSNTTIYLEIRTLATCFSLKWSHRQAVCRG